MNDPVFRHCDDYIDDQNEPELLRKFLEYQRLPASMKYPYKEPPRPESAPVYADFTYWVEGSRTKKRRVKLTMASRMGDVGIKYVPFTSAPHVCYDQRVPLYKLSNFSEQP